MPELPEVETVRMGLEPVLDGHTFTKVVTRRSDLRRPFPPDFAKRLTGRKVKRLWRRAKYLLADLDDGETLVVHLGMSGRMVVYAEGRGRELGIYAHEEPELLTAPMPSYVSMQSALHFHGMIEQIPAVVFVATLARSQTLVTRAGTFSLHHLAPEVFGGFVEADGAKIASPPKALFDVAYLSAARDRRFRTLPELELPHRFAWDELRYWIGRVRSARQKTIVVARLRAILGAVVSERTLDARLLTPRR